MTTADRTATKTLTCPNCAGPLSAQARWRTVTCAYCGTSVAPAAVVTIAAETFHAAALRTDKRVPASNDVLDCGSERYRLLQRVGEGEHAEVFLAERLRYLTERVVIKLARLQDSADIFAGEFETLSSLQRLEAAGAAYYLQRLPQPIRLGTGHGADGRSAAVFVQRNPAGYWGTLAQARALHHAPFDARHGVWILRRILELLQFLHAQGFSHGAIRAEHLLVNPRDHGVLLIGWRRFARHHSKSMASAAQMRDLQSAAWTVRELIGASEDDFSRADAVPEALATLLSRIAAGESEAMKEGAGGLLGTLSLAAQASFGPPEFLPFQPDPRFQH